MNDLRILQSYTSYRTRAGSHIGIEPGRLEPNISNGRSKEIQSNCHL
jgi:hypothetical protein